MRITLHEIIWGTNHSLKGIIWPTTCWIVYHLGGGVLDLKGHHDLRDYQLGVGKNHAMTLFILVL